MEKERIIITDCDGCLVLWNDGFSSFMADKGLPQLPNTDDCYNISERHGITTKQSMALVREYNEGPWIEHLEPFADAVNYVKRLADKGFRFIVVTSLSDAPHAHYYRTKNLTSIFGNIFDDIHCIQLGASKAHILTTWADTGYFWIEDHMRNAEAGHEVGLKSVLINHPYNSHYRTDLFPTVSCTSPWREIYDMISKEYNL